MGDGAKAGRLEEAAERLIFLADGDRVDREGVTVVLSILRFLPLPPVNEVCSDLKAVLITPRIDEMDELRVFE